MSEVLNLKKGKAELMLKKFLEENPEMVKRQEELTIQLSHLSPEDRMIFLATELKGQLSKLQVELTNIKKTIESLEPKK